MGEDVDMAEIKDALSNCEKVANGKNLVDEMKEAKRGRKRKRHELSDGDDDDQSNEENVASLQNIKVSSSPCKKARRTIHNHARNRMQIGRKSTEQGSKGNVVSKVVDKKSP